MEKLIITAAICGAEVTKAQNEAVPYTVEEMVREAKSAYEAGAAILHIHVREDDGTPTQGRERFKVVMDAIRKELPDVIMIPSTGGATGMSPEERLQPTELFPEMATLDCGTCNFGDEIFDNTMPTMRAFGKRMIENGIKPEYECFELGHAVRCLQARKVLVQLVAHGAHRPDPRRRCRHQTGQQCQCKPFVPQKFPDLFHVRYSNPSWFRLIF